MVAEGFASSLGLLLERFRQVERVRRHRRARRLDLAPEIFRLEDEELAAIREIGQDVLLETDDFVLLAIVVVIVVAGGREVYGYPAHPTSLGS